MRIHDPKFRNMAHALSLMVFIAFKGSNLYFYYQRYIDVVECLERNV